jgi:hypothetical protein
MSLDSFGATALCAFTKALTGARILWLGCPPAAVPRVYYGNHASHGDFALIWACLPPDLRVRTRPVAGADYWLASKLRKYVAEHVIRAVLIDRNRATRTEDPIRQMAVVLEAGDSLIVFPEGTRNTTDAALLAVQERHLSPGRGLPRRGVRAGLDREHAPRDAQRQVVAGATAVHVIGRARPSSCSPARTRMCSSTARVTPCWR